MTTWHTRLTQARNARGIDKAELARRVGVSGPTVTDWEKGKIKTLEAVNLLNVCAELRINPVWLMHGKGPMAEDDRSLTTPVDANAPSTHAAAPTLSPRQQALLGYFDGLTTAQQDAVLRDLQEKKQVNDDLVAELLQRRKAS